ncbi:MAG: thioredoxin family protein [Bacteroidia bacterium]|nr:thioredoxin family protein [Bacteroidia bacterium]MDW8088378.1 thioredoxin family protein [Bacteroidia bacterium]
MGRIGLLFCFSFLAAQGPWYETDIPTAFAKARRAKKPLWIMVSATWCSPCKLVEQKVLTSKSFQEAVRKAFIPLKVYANSGAKSTPGADSLAQARGVEAFPTFLYLEPSGEEFYRQLGIPEIAQPGEEALVKAFLENLEQAQKSRIEIRALHQRFDKGERNPEFLRTYLQRVVEIHLLNRVDTVLYAYTQAAGSIKKGWVEVSNGLTLLGDLARLHPRYRTYVLGIADSLRPFLDSQAYKRLYLPLLAEEFERQLMHKTSLAQALEEGERFIKAQAKGFPFVEEIVLSSLCDWGSKQAKADELDLWAQVAVQYVAFLWRTIASEEKAQRQRLSFVLNNLAWTFYEKLDNPFYLWVAVIWARQALTYAPEDWYIWDTLGALYYKLRRKAEAVEALSRAIELAQKGNLEEVEYAETKKLLNQAQNLPD